MKTFAFVCQSSERGFNSFEDYWLLCIIIFYIKRLWISQHCSVRYSKQMFIIFLYTLKELIFVKGILFTVKLKLKLFKKFRLILVSNKLSWFRRSAFHRGGPISTSGSFHGVYGRLRSEADKLFLVYFCSLLSILFRRYIAQMHCSNIRNEIFQTLPN
jgi:hypothetical protein